MSLRHWIWLSMRSIRRDKLWQLCVHFNGAQGVYDALDSEILHVAELTRQELDSLHQDRMLMEAEKIESVCEKKKIAIIAFTDDVYPNRLRCIESPPIILYARGNVNTLTAKLPFSIVGTRKASAESLEITHKIAYMLAKSDFTIVSGMAAGVDSAAACGALDAGRSTIAVFGSGVDICYPRQNEKLMEAIMANGCVISENIPGTPPRNWTFPQRNRIIAGMSAGVLITAAPEKSGSIITATYAMEQGRDVYVTPGSLSDPEYAGSLALIKDGASMITDVDDIIYDFGKTPAKADKSYERILKMRKGAAPISMAPNKNDNNLQKSTINKTEKADKTKELHSDPMDSFNDEDRIIAEAIMSGAAQFDAIAEKTGLDAGDLFAKLTVLEIEGKVMQKPGKYYELVM